MFIHGINPTETVTDLTQGRGYNPGDLGELQGKQYVYVKASANISQYDVVTFDETWITTVAPLSTSNDARGDKIGVAAVAITSGDYGWLQIYGPCIFKTASACVANVELSTTSGAGVLDDATTSSLMVADNMVVTTAHSASLVAAAAGILNYPQVGRTL
jgi:hypothetical protein